MKFEEIFFLLRTGCKIRRDGWNGKRMWIALQIPDEHSKMGEPYIYIRNAQGKFVPWNPSQSDMLAEDWTEVFVCDTCYAEYFSRNGAEQCFKGSHESIS
jgi:hypothetical protein